MSLMSTNVVTKNDSSIKERWPGAELKLTLLATWPDRSTQPAVQAHVSLLPPLPPPPIRCEFRGAPRANALAKSSSWVTSRSPLESLMRSGSPKINEFLLVGDSGSVPEGSQTNFYAVMNGVLHTAGEGVLAGTVRRLLLE
ncbi:hypothetical protein TrRE_jg12883, partial [Triparma retinervis]